MDARSAEQLHARYGERYRWLLQRIGLRRSFGLSTLLLMLGGIAGGIGTAFPLVIAARVA